MAFIRVKIDGVDVSTYVIEATVDDTSESLIDDAELVFDTRVRSAVAFDSSSSVTIERGPDNVSWRYIFRGFVEAWTNSDNTIHMKCPNKLWQLKNKQITATFDKDDDPEAGDLGELLRTLVTEYGNLSADSSSIPSTISVQGFALRKFICRSDNLWERIMVLVETLGYLIWYNPVDDLVYVQPEGYLTHKTTLNYSKTEQIYHQRQPKVEKDFSRIVNVVKVFGARQFQSGISESFDGNGSNDTFTLVYNPEDTDVVVDGVTQTRGALDQGGDFDYVVDREKKQVIFETASVPGVGSGNVVITYSANVPTPVVLRDDESITSYTAGEERQQSYSFNDIISVDDAELRAQEILNENSSPIIKYQAYLNPSIPIVLPGYQQQIVDTYNNVNQSLVVRAVRRSWPDYEDQVTYSTERLTEPGNLEALKTRLERLERDNLRNEERVRFIYTGLVSARTGVRSVQLYKVAQSATVGTWGAAASDWGTAKWGQSAGTEVLAQVLQGNDEYAEYLYDTVFIDTDNTTATVDTTNRRIT